MSYKFTRLAAGVGVLASVIGFVVVPTATRSSLQELAYWVDWANLARIALCIAVAELAFAWAAGVLWRGNIIRSRYSLSWRQEPCAIRTPN